MTVTADFRDAVISARRPVRIEAGRVSRLATVVSGIPGADRLPRALVTLLENVVRRAATDDDAVRMAAAIVDAGTEGRGRSSRRRSSVYSPARTRLVLTSSRR